MERLPPLPPQSPLDSHSLPPRPDQTLSPHPAPGPLCPPPRRGLAPLGTPGAPRRPGSGPQAGRAGAGPERAARAPGLREPVPASAPAEGRGRRRPVPVRSLSPTGSGATSGAHIRPGGRPLSREVGRGSRGGGWGARAALAPSHAPRPAPGRGRTAPPPAPAHRLTPALTHTHTPSRALTHALPSLLLLCLSPPAVWGPKRSPATRLRHAVSASAPRLAAGG